LFRIIRIIYVVQLHVGTSEVGKLEAKKVDVIRHARVLREQIFKPDPDDEFHLEQNFHRIKPALPAASGGLHSGTLPEVIKTMGVDLVIQVGGGVIRHPDGPSAGAASVRQAIEAAIKGMPLDEYAKEHKELRRELEKWGYAKPI